jgi:hypothetical protein
MFLFTQQKIDGFLDVTADPRGTGTFVSGRTTPLLNPQGVVDIDDYDDTQWTTASVNLAYTYKSKVTLSVGYAYDKYKFADAFNSDNSLFVQSPLFFMQENNGDYSANIVYTKLTYRF